ncbi:MAG: hypothetical protein AAGA18_06530 [Verrucomicrobiota bacterium]
MNISKQLDYRVNKILQKLEQRALQAPGLYPIKRGQDFLSIVTHGLEKYLNRPLGIKLDELKISDKILVVDWLEDLWRCPERAIQLNAQFLIDKGKGLSNNSLLFTQEITG